MMFTYRPVQPYATASGIWLALLILFVCFQRDATAQPHAGSPVQSDLEQNIARHISAGEFPKAVELIEQLPATQQDRARALLVRQQLRAGATKGAALTALSFRDEQVRQSELARIKRLMNPVMDGSRSNPPSSPGLAQPPSAGQGFGGAAGGITESDYEPLIDLITGTIAADKWEEGGAFKIRPYPSGVFVDHSATLRLMKVDSSRFGKLLPKRSASNGNRNTWFEDQGNRDARWPSTLRKVSLNRLERTAEIQFALGLEFEDTLLNMAGLTEVQYVFIDREQGEIVIAGPAGAWEYDSTGRAVNSETGKPVLQLEDFVVVLRNAFQAGGKFGCSIDPRAENLAAVQTLLQEPVRSRRSTQWKKKLRAAMGQQDIVVFGIDPQTHAARVLVEADHHMKLVGMGLEPSIVEVPSYLERLGGLTPSAMPNDVVRWWFTAKESELACDPARESFELTGTGVQVRSESELLQEDGTRLHTGQSSPPTEGFARDFTKNYAKMAARYPVYHELQNIFSLALVANLIKIQGLDQRCQRGLSFFKGSTKPEFPIRLSPAPKQVDTVMNERVFEQRRGNSTERNTVIAVSGGVQFDLQESLQPSRISPVNRPQLESIKQVDQMEAPIWWWD